MAILNKKARHLYEIVDTWTAGIVLAGSEIKSVREGRASLVEAYCHFRRGELWVRNMHIAEYKWANRNNHEPKRERKLLLNRGELRRIEAKVKEKGFTVVPLKMFISDRGYAKLEIALVRGKKVHDKRTAIKERDIARDMDRERREYMR